MTIWNHEHLQQCPSFELLSVSNIVISLPLPTVSQYCINFLSPIDTLLWSIFRVRLQNTFVACFASNCKTQTRETKRELKKAERFQSTVAQIYWYGPPLQTNALLQQRSLQCCEPIQDRQTGSKKVAGKLIRAAAGDRTRVTRVTGGNTYHYTTTTFKRPAYMDFPRVSLYTIK